MSERSRITLLLVLLTLVAGLLTWTSAMGGNRSSSSAQAEEHSPAVVPERARALCTATLGRSVASAIPATVRELRERRGGPPPASSTVPLFPRALASDFGAWCWIRASASTYSAVAVTADGDTFTVMSNIRAVSPPSDLPAPP